MRRFEAAGKDSGRSLDAHASGRSLDSHAPGRSLDELAGRLLASADPALLDAALDALPAERALDDEARELFAQIHAAGEADSLRDLLRDGRLVAWAEHTATEREERTLRAQLSRWLGAARLGGDDPARLSVVAELPRELEAILKWARPYDLLGELTRPASEVLPGATELPPDATLLECCLGQLDARGRKGSVLSLARAQERAREHLIAEAARHGALAARAALWQRAPRASVRLLCERLRALLSGTELPLLGQLRFLPARPVSLQVGTGKALGQLVTGDDKGSLTARIFLSGYESRALASSCECGRPSCMHVRALAARLLDACLDPDDRLHAALVSFCDEPSWKRFVRALDADAGTDTSPRDEAREPRVRAQELVFLLRVDGSRVSVGAFVKDLAARGRRTQSAGKLGSPRALLRSSRALREDERRVLERMAAANRSTKAVFVPADMTLLRALVGQPAVRIEGTPDALRVREERLRVELVEQPGGVLPKVLLAGTDVLAARLPRERGLVVQHDPSRAALYFAELTPPLTRLLGALESFHGVLPAESYAKLAPWLATLGNVAEVVAPAAMRGHERPAPKKLLLRIVPGVSEGVEVTLVSRPLPLSPLWPPGQGPDLCYGLEDSVHVFSRRDLDAERSIAEQVIAVLGLREHMRLEAFAYRIESDQAALSVLASAARLTEFLDLEWAERINRLQVTSRVSVNDLSIQLVNKGQWLQVKGGSHDVQADVAIGRMLEAVRLGERYVRVEGRSYVEIEQDLFERLAKAQLCLNESVREPSLPHFAVPFWDAALGAQARGGDTSTAQLLERIRAQTLPAEGDAAPVPAACAPHLRDYQRIGVSWLVARSAWAPGVCLADEMGLGKTVQLAALLSHRAALGPALVIAPTSVVDNWASELARFAPELRSSLHREQSRKAEPTLAAGEVLITSYELWLRDGARWKDLRFATQVIDEAQLVRNARTQRAEAVASVQADFRVALSGTPIENRMGDLWSVFQLITPGLLGPWSRFRTRFAVPIERYEDAERASALRTLVSPFLLRRTKSEVATELPLRTEIIHRIELSPAEQDLYMAAVRRARRALGKRRPDDAARSVQILAELTKLRQLACHPRLVIEDERLGSSKLSALLTLLDDILPRGHRALIFSQFTRHLALVRAALVAREIPLLYLDGSTPAAQRAELLQRFQRGEGKVFLISLKAGGTGLNLTAADYVVHMDPWWNPAAEDQASDRAHRIGQERPVSIVKLVAQDTIEERVLELHERKRRLAASVLSGSHAPLALDAGTLEELLALA